MERERLVVASRPGCLPSFDAYDSSENEVAPGRTARFRVVHGDEAAEVLGSLDHRPDVIIGRDAEVHPVAGAQTLACPRAVVTSSPGSRNSGAAAERAPQASSTTLRPSALRDPAWCPG